MAIFTFKFDESYKDKRTLVVAGWFADDKQWKRVESRWQKAMAFENNSLPNYLFLTCSFWDLFNVLITFITFTLLF